MPILIDYSAVAIATLFASKTEIAEDLLRHQIINNLRSYNVKFRADYGEMILACDSGSWRKDVFPQYKFKRAEKREDSKVDWKEFFRILNLVRDEIRENVPWRVVSVPKAEADDVIAVLATNTSAPAMIVSNDHDFVQLQTKPRIKQYSPLKKSLVKVKDTNAYLTEQIISGCKGDGVPNMLSADDCFVTGTRQTSIRIAQLAEWIDNPPLTHPGYIRNRVLISFDCIPASVRQSIIDTSAAVTVKSNILPYLISHRCNNLIAQAADFYPATYTNNGQHTRPSTDSRDSLEAFLS